MKILRLTAIIPVSWMFFACSGQQELGERISRELARKSLSSEGKNLLQRLQGKNTTITLVDFAKKTEPEVVDSELHADLKDLKGKEGFVVTVPVEEHRLALATGLEPIFAFVPADISDDDLKEVKGFDAKGNTIVLSMDEVPERPVVAISQAEHEVTTTGFINLDQGASPSPKADDTNTTYGEFLTSVQFADVKEPWIKGAAEIYALVSFIDRTGKPLVQVVDLAGVTQKDQLFFPDKLLHLWQENSYQVVDVAFYEHDSKYDFSQIAKLATDSAAAAATVLQPEVAPAAATGSKLLGDVFDVLPKSAWTDDDDFLDVINNVEKYDSFAKVDRYGMTSNVQATFESRQLKKNDESAR